MGEYKNSTLQNIAGTTIVVAIIVLSTLYGITTLLPGVIDVAEEGGDYGDCGNSRRRDSSMFQGWRIRSTRSIKNMKNHGLP